MKNELLYIKHNTTILERFILVACEINNAWYKRSMERKGKYNPDYKRTAEGTRRPYRS